MLICSHFIHHLWNNYKCMAMKMSSQQSNSYVNHSPGVDIAGLRVNKSTKLCISHSICKNNSFTLETIYRIMVIANIYWILSVCQALFYFIITATIKGEAIIIPNLWLQKLNCRNVKELAQGNVTIRGKTREESPSSVLSEAVTLTTVLWWLFYRASHVPQSRWCGEMQGRYPCPHMRCLVALKERGLWGWNTSVPTYFHLHFTEQSLEKTHSPSRNLFVRI